MLPYFKEILPSEMEKGKKNRSKVLHLPHVGCIYNFMKLSMCIYNFNVAVRISINLQGFRKNTPCSKSIKRYEKEVFDIDKLQQ